MSSVTSAWKRFVIERDVGHAAHDDAGALAPRPSLEATDVVEVGDQRIGRRAGKGTEVGRLQREEEQREETNEDEQPHQSGHRSFLYHRFSYAVRSDRHQRGQQEVEPQHRQRRDDHGNASSPGPRPPASAWPRDRRRARRSRRRRPKITLLMTPLPMSVQMSTPACICDQNDPASTPIICTPTIQPPKTPTAENIAASSGMADQRGDESRRQHPRHRVDGHHFHRGQAARPPSSGRYPR